MAERAVVLMGKLPRAGRVKTRLVPPLTPEIAAGLYAAFLEDTFALVEEAHRLHPSGFDRVFCCALGDDEDAKSAHQLLPSPAWRVLFQRGAELGERIENAYEDAAAFKTVIIGSDAPTMPPGRILEAFSELDGGARAVFGPTLDGGYDLVALPKLVRALFERIPWSTDRVMEATRARARAEGMEIHELDLGYDVDTIEDLARALEDARRPGSHARRTREAIAGALASRTPAD